MRRTEASTRTHILSSGGCLGLEPSCALWEQLAQGCPRGYLSDRAAWHGADPQLHAGQGGAERSSRTPYALTRGSNRDG
jgi:hypothetical protein